MSRESKSLNFWQKLTISLLVFVFIFSSPGLLLAAEEAAAPATDSSAQADTSSAAVTNQAPTDTVAPAPDSSASVTNATPADSAPATPDDAAALAPKTDAEQATQQNTLDSEEDPGDLSNSDARKPLGAKLNTETDQTTGALVYTFPLRVAPGRNGLQPDLKLVYNSQSGDNSNLFGYGWSINTPYIERLPKEGVNNLYSEIYFTSSLSGELEDIDLSDSTHGTYGAKVDNGDFLNYEYNANNYWLVTDKKGTVYTFGATAGARQDDPDNSSHAFKWMLAEVRDTNDNYITYAYYKDAGQIYPSTITYTGHDTTDGILSVEFTRESRSDDLISYKTGFGVTTNYRISEIKSKVNSTWFEKYELAYGSGDNGVRSTLTSLTETGQDEQSQTIELPANTFSYQTKTPGWTQDTNWTLPEAFTEIYSYASSDRGVRIVDVNGDGLPDIVISNCYNYNFYNNPQCATSLKKVYINNGSDGWIEDSNFVIPVYFYGESNPGDNANGAQLIDVNGDGFTDIIYQKYTLKKVYLNKKDGTGWQQDQNWTIPGNISVAGNDDYGTRLGDVNGDGLPDILTSSYSVGVNKVYINNGSGWVYDSNYVIPTHFLVGSYGTDSGARLEDINGDGLVDIVKNGYEMFPPWPYPQAEGSKVYINKGSGTGWVEDTNWEVPLAFVDYWGTDLGARMADVNGDGLPDLLYSSLYYSQQNQKVLINSGNNFVYDSSWQVPEFFVAGNYYGLDYGTRLADITGDGLVDIVRSYSEYQNGQFEFHQAIYLANSANADLLNEIDSSKGAETAITYKATPQYQDGSGNLLNPNLPMVMQTVYQITNDDGLGNESTDTYEYKDGEYYFADYLNRKFSGFNQVLKTDALGNVSKTFFHQANDSDSSHGEYNDDVSKIGKVYRTEVYDDSANLYSKSISKWENYDLGDDNDFVKLTQAINFSYDADTSHKDKAETSTYDNANGNLTEKITWGEVTGSDNGTFTDIGTDKFTTDIDYAATSGSEVIGLPSQETTVDQSSNKVKETKYYYDTLTLGNVDEGNLTKQEIWKSGTAYIDLEKTYNSYGLVTQEKDPLDQTTDYTYDTYNLYPATVTNALDQETAYEYDYSSGQVTEITDPNSRVFQTVYDALDRPVQVKQPDLTTPSTLVVKTAYTYTDSSCPTSVQQTNYLDSSTSFDVYTYLDGFGRKIQARKEAEASNTFSVKDFIYNELGLIDQESLPYFSTGSSRTTATTDNSLYTSYAYDPLQRVITATNAVGTTTNTYDDWELTITDAASNVKDLYKDAYDNLIQVDEHNDANTYTTNYEYNGLGNLTQITDSQDNVRNFTYDGLGRRLTAEDLHDPDDEYFGDWSYSYDDAGNLTSRTDPKSQTVNWAYDDLNRALTEDYTGQSGTEITYVYDTGTDAIGRLYTATTPDVVTTYTYNALGGVKSENKNIDSEDYLTEFAYDRQANQTLLTYPSEDEVKYEYNTAGLVEKVQGKPAGTQYFGDVVSNYDYSPLEQVAVQADANGVITYNDYDSQKLYRLKEKITASPDEGDYGEGVISDVRLRQDSAVASALADRQPDIVPDDKTPHDILGRPIKTDNYPKDTTIYIKTDPNAKPSTLPADIQKAYSEASKNWGQKTELKSFVPKEAIEFYDNQSSGAKAMDTLLSGTPPNPSTDLESESLQRTENIIYNWGFEDGFAYWDWQNNLDATHQEDCTVSYAGDCSEKVTVNTSGSSWQVQLAQPVRLDANVNYKLRFKAKASTATTFTFEAGQNHSPWNNLGIYKDSQYIPTDWQNYEFTFTALASDPNARITFELGANSANYWFDEIELIPDHLNSVLNPSYEYWTANWDFFSLGGQGGTGTNNLDCADFSEGQCSDRIDVSQAGMYYDVTLSQPTSVVQDQPYVLTFYAKSDYDNRTARVVLNQNHSPWQDLTSLAEFTLNSSSGWQKYQVELTPTSTDSNARLLFYVGDYTGSVYFDQISLWPKQATKLSDTTPEFSAIYNDPDSGDYVADYQLQVIKYDGDWDNPLWDSGQTVFSSSVLEGDRTEDIVYDGPELRLDGMKYYWRIKLWDDDDNEGQWTNGKDYFVMAGKRIQDLSYTYDDVGNITQIIDESETNTKKKAEYAYDDLYRLTSATITDSATNEDYTQTYTYDSLGNFTNRSDAGDYEYTGNTGTSYANPHAVTDINGLALSYDNNGNLINAGIGNWNILTPTWDYNNRMASSSGIFQTPATYAYDQEGNRVIKNVDSGSAITVYPNKYYEKKVAGENETVTENVYANGQLVLTATNDGSSFNIFYVHGDHLTSSSVMTKDDGAMEQVIDYYPYGNIRFNEQNSTYDQARKFTQKEIDSDASGLAYFGARYYSGEVGRFVSEDPVFWDFDNAWLLDPQIQNSYSYARNNPLVYIDPDGNKSIFASLMSVVKSAVSFVTSIFSQPKPVTQPQVTTPTVNQAAAQKTVPTNNTQAQKTITWDSISNERIKQLDSRVQQPATNFVNETESQLNVQLRVTTGFRSIEEQDRLYNQSRSDPPTGPWATNAKGGQSYHNYGLAIDVVRMENGQPKWTPINQEIANIGIKQGFDWGGNWASPKDFPHFEMSFGQSWQDLSKSSQE